MRKLRPLLTFLLFPLLINAQGTSQLKGVGLYTGPLPSVINYNTTFGNYLYLAGDDNIHIYDLADPENPAYVKSIPDSNAKKIWAGGNSILAVYDGRNISLYDISDPENPNKKSDYTAGDDIVHCMINGNFMYVMYMFELSYNKEGSFEIIDISDPSKPTLTDSFKQGYDNGSSFCLSHDFSKVYTANYNYADEKTVIHELDISNPYDIKDLKTIKLDYMTQSIDIYDSYIFLLQFKPWSGPSYLKAINVADDNNWIDYSLLPVSNSQSQDMHVQDSSLTISLLEGGIKDYTFSTSTNTFIEGQSIEYDRASHMAYTSPIPSTGPSQTNMLFKRADSYEWSLTFYYAMDNNAPATGYHHSYGGKRLYVVKKWVKKNIEGKVFLTMDIEPTDAERNGCGVSPSLGTHEYNKDESVILTSTDNPNGGWFFDEWTGAVSGTEKQAILLMDENKTVVAHFKEVKLSVTGSKTEMKCICDFNNEEVNMVTLSATAYGDNWIMTGITLKADGYGDDAEDLAEVNVKQGNNKLWYTTAFEYNNGVLTATFPQPIKILEGHTQTFTINYIFKLTQDSLEQRVNSISYGVTGNAIATPEHYSIAAIIGSARGSIEIGRVFNLADKMFMDITTAIKFSAEYNTSNEIIVCPGTYRENLEIHKPLTLRSLRSRDETIIKPKYNYIDISAIDIRSDVTIKDLTITDCGLGIIIANGKNVIIDNCSLTNIGKYGIQLFYPKSVEIKNCNFSNISKINSAGISVEYSTLSVIHNNTFNNCYFGIHVWGKALVNTSETQIFSNYINSSNDGMRIWNTENCSAKNNSINNSFTGISVYNCNNISLNENDISFCSHSGIQMSNGKNSVITKNTSQKNFTGIKIIDSNNLIVTENDINFNETDGINVYISSNSLFERNKSWKNFTGIDLDKCTNLRFTGNKLFDNITGFKASNSSQIDFSSSNVSANNGTNTGISLNNSDISLTGNSISDNNGNGILLANNSSANISHNNIFGNAGFAILNDNQNANMDLSNNWWGDKNGPAQGSIQGNFSISNWLISPVSLVSKPRKDTMYVVSGTTDSAFAYFQNLNSPNDILDITVSDNKGWIKSSNSFSQEMRDSSGLTAKIIFSIPINIKSGIVNKVFINALSHNDTNVSVKDSFCIATYTAELAELSVGPDSTTIAPGDSLQLFVNGYDQFGNNVYVNPIWQTSIGEINSNGLFKCSQLGTATITATDLSTGKKGNATVIVSNVVHVKEEKELVKEYNLYQNYPNPFNPVTKISYAIPQTAQVKIIIYNILGQVVKVLIDKEQQPGNYTVDWNAKSVSSGVYICCLETTNSKKNFTKSIKMLVLK